jgi:hypothetical protein
MADIDETDSAATLIPNDPDLDRLRDTALFIEGLKKAAAMLRAS